MRSKNKIADVHFIQTADLRACVNCTSDEKGLCTLWNLIKENKWEDLKRVFSCIENEVGRAILNGTDLDVDERKTKKDRILSWLARKPENLQKESRPLFQAVMFGSFECVEVLRNLGANILQQEKHGWNIVHYLAVVSYFSLDYETKAVKIFKKLIVRLESFEIQALLLMEDKEGMRPLELAVHCGCLILARNILNTDGVYLVKVQRRGLTEKSWYDVSEYESAMGAKLRKKNPVMLLTFLDRKILKHPKALQELRRGVFHEWSQVKFKTNVVFIILWFLQRVLCFVAFYCIVAVDTKKYFERLYSSFFGGQNKLYSGSNSSGGNTYNSSDCVEFSGWYVSDDETSFCIITGLYSLLVTTIALSLLFDCFIFVIQFCVPCASFQTCFGKHKNLAINPTFYRVSQAFFMVTALLYLAQATLEAFHIRDSSNVFIHVCLIISCYLSVWSILYFVQLLPSIGHFVNIVQRMQIILMNFSIVYLIVFFPFPHVFLVLLRDGTECQVDGFEDLFTGFYSVFQIMVNLLNFRQTYGPTGKQHLLAVLSSRIRQSADF